MSARRERGSHADREAAAVAVVWSDLQPVAAHDIAPDLCVGPPAGGAVRPCLRQVWQLPGRSEHTPHQARTLVGGICRRWRVARRVVDDLLVIVSELVTNAVVHAPGEQVTVAVVLTATDVGVAVIDQGPRRPMTAHVAEAEDEHGRGLFLVLALADRHGAQPAGGGTAVWACLTLPPPRPLTHGAPAAHAPTPDGADGDRHLQEGPDAPRGHA